MIRITILLPKKIGGAWFHLGAVGPNVGSSDAMAPAPMQLKLTDWVTFDIAYKFHNIYHRNSLQEGLNRTPRA